MALRCIEWVTNVDRSYPIKTLELLLVYRLVNLFRKWQDLWRLPMLCEFC
jgi:hypothetical protein